MSYTVLTPAYYDAVIAGAMGGFLDGQAGDSIARSTYSTPAAAAVAFAQEIDTLLGALTSTVAKANVLDELAGAWARGRTPSAANPAAFTPASYAAQAAALIEAWTTAIAFLA